jgi:hypothetical protein
MLTALIGALATRFKTKISVIKQHLDSAVVEEWGKVQRVDSDAGDIMTSSTLRVTRDDSRDATFVRVCVIETYLQILM